MISSMHGPEFLAAYAVYLLFAILFFRRKIKSSTGDPAALQEAIDLQAVDPLSIAYLQGGDIAVLKTASHRLLEKGYLRQSTTKGKNDKKLTTLILSKGIPANIDHPVEEIIIKYLKKLRDVHKLINDGKFREEMDSCCRRTYWESLADQGLMYYPKAISAYSRWAYLVILAPGIYKLIGSLLRGHFNIWILLICMIVVVPVSIHFFLRRFRLTPEGEGYLRTLRQNIREAANKADESDRSEVRGQNLNALMYIMIGSGLIAGSSHCRQQWRRYYATGLQTHPR